MENIITTISLDLLTTDSVSVETKKFYVDKDGSKLQLGDPFRRSYANSIIGIAQLKDEVPEPYLSSILTIWGDTPTVVEKF